VVMKRLRNFIRICPFLLSSRVFARSASRRASGAGARDQVPAAGCGWSCASGGHEGLWASKAFECENQAGGRRFAERLERGLKRREVQEGSGWKREGREGRRADWIGAGWSGNSEGWEVIFIGPWPAWESEAVQKRLGTTWSPSTSTTLQSLGAYFAMLSAAEDQALQTSAPYRQRCSGVECAIRLISE
jgi:hypothetical protein